MTIQAYGDEGLIETATSVDQTLFGSKFYVFRTEYRMPVSIQLDSPVPWTDTDSGSPNSPSSAIFSGSVYSYYYQYYYYDLSDEVDEDTLHESSKVYDSYTFTVESGEMTMLGYYEWDITDDGTWEYKCPEDSTAYASDANTGYPLCMDTYGDDVDSEIITTAETIWKYVTVSSDDVTNPTLTVDTDDETLYSISYSESEANGLKNRFGMGDIEDALTEISNFFSSSASTLFNTMNVSRFNFKKTDAPTMSSTNLSAIGTLAGGSALSTDMASTTSTAGGGY